MDNNNWRPTAPGGEPVMDGADWRAQLPIESRLRIVNKIMETLKRHLPFPRQEGLQELKKIAERLEEKIYIAATDQNDYLRKISLKMLSLESKSQVTMPNSLSNSSANSSRPPDPGASQGMQTQVHSQGQTGPMQLSVNQPQVQQLLLSQNMQNNNMAAAGIQGSTGLQTTMPPISGLNQSPIPSIVNQNPSMQNISGISQNSVGNSMGQGVSSNMFANSQRQMPGRQQVVPQQQQQQQQQPQNPQQYLYQQHQLQQQLLNKKFPHGNLSHSLVQSQMQQPQQQPQQNFLQQNQLQTSQPSGIQTSSMMQPSMMQSAAHSSLRQNPPSSIQQSTQSTLQQHSQAVLRQHQQPQQTASVHQQQTPIMQQSLLPSQQQELVNQSSNTTNMQQNQLIAQQTSAGEMQQQQQRMVGQQNNLQSLQQQQQRQLMSQQNNLTSMQPQQLGPQSSVNGLQQQQQQQHQQLLGTHSGNSNMQNSQHPAHMMQQPKMPLQHQTPQNVPSLLANQGQQSQMQLGQQQVMSRMLSQSAQLQQQLGMQQQQRIQAQGQAPGSLLQAPNVIDQQKQLYQSQRALPETSSTSLDSTAQTGQVSGGDWQEEIYQQIKAMKERYLPELNEIYQIINIKLQQHEALQQSAKSEQLDKLKRFNKMLEHFVAFLQVSKSNVLPSFKEKLGAYENQIINCLNTNKPRKTMPPMQQGYLGQSQMHSMQQSQSLMSQVQPHENQITPQIQSMNSQGAVQTMQQNNASSIQHNSLSSLSGVSAPLQNMMNSLQPGSNMDSGKGNQLSSMQQVTSGPIQQGTVSAPQQSNINPLSTQTGVNMLQPNIPLQATTNMLQHHQQEQLLQMQQLKQSQQRQMQKPQFHQHNKQQLPVQQLPVQMQTHQMQQLNQMNDVNEMKLREGMGVKPGVFQQHLQSSRLAYPGQQTKLGASFPVSPSQMLHAASPQLPQHSSPQIDQQNLLPSMTKTGTPLQSASSPFVIPSPSTPLASSPMPGDSEKPISSVSSLANAANIGHQQTTSTQSQAPSLAIGTPGISASPLLAEFAGTDGAHANAVPAVSGKSSVTEQPLERLIRAVKSISSKALSASVSDIGSVVSMIDRIVGSAPGNGSKAAVGEDLVAMTKCCLQARNFVTQDGVTGNRKTRRYKSAMPLNIVSSAGSISDNFKQLASPEASDSESTATSSVKRPRIDASHALLEQIQEINQQLIDTVVDISDEDVDPTTAAAEGGEGTIVKCSFSAVALCPTLKAQYASAQMSPIQPLRLLIPTNYPNCSPVLLDNFPVEVSKECEDISMKAKSKFSISLRSLSQPMSLGDIARTWDVCARTVISEHAQKSCGGTFSSKYGTWENCLSAV